MRLNDGDDLEVATEEDFGVRRDSDGDLLPVKQRIPGTDKAIKCKPVTPGLREEYVDVFETDDAESERIAELWNDRIVEGIGADATAEYVDSLPYGIIAGIIQALKNSSGEQVFLAVREQVNEEIATNMEMAEAMDEEVLETFMDLVDSETEQ